MVRKLANKPIRDKYYEVPRRIGDTEMQKQRDFEMVVEIRNEIVHHLPRVIRERQPSWKVEGGGAQSMSLEEAEQGAMRYIPEKFRDLHRRGLFYAPILSAPTNPSVDKRIIILYAAAVVIGVLGVIAGMAAVNWDSMAARARALYRIQIAAMVGLFICSLGVTGIIVISGLGALELHRTGLCNGEFPRKGTPETYFRELLSEGG